MNVMSDIIDLEKLQQGVSFENLAAVYLLGSDDRLERNAPIPIDSYAFVFVLSGEVTLCLDTEDYSIDCHSSYMVSLPIVWKGDKQEIEWKSSWRLENYGENGERTKIHTKSSDFEK